jgi:hypothetical protein
VASCNLLLNWLCKNRSHNPFVEFDSESFDEFRQFFKAVQRTCEKSQLNSLFQQSSRENSISFRPLNSSS